MGNLVAIIQFIFILLFGRARHPYFPNLRESRSDDLHFESFTRGVLISGDPGKGKTVYSAMMVLRYSRRYPDRPIFLFDYSGSQIDELIALTFTLPAEEGETLRRRIILDLPGHERLVVPRPLFSSAYGLDDEELVQKVKNITMELNPELIARNPSMSTSIKNTGPNIYRLLMAMPDDNGSCWQITEAKKLLVDPDLLQVVVKRYGGQVPGAKWDLEKGLLKPNLTAAGREARTTALLGALGVIESRPLRARYGYPQPGITEKEIIDRGLIYCLSGEKMTNQDDAQAWVFWEAFAALRAVINRRVPHDPADKPVLLIIDEVYRLFEIKGMAKALGEISTYFRSRGLMPVIIIQAYWQLNDLLKEQIWNLGNIVTFSLENFDDAYKFVQQVFKYDPQSEKLPARSDLGQPIIETDRGQYLTGANWIQHLEARQVVMRRYLSEQERERHIAFVAQTADKPPVSLPRPLVEIKENLLARCALPIEDALAVVNKRKFTFRTDTHRPTL